MTTIRAMGMVTCFGPLVPSCAAFRAGLSGAEGARDFEIFVPGGKEPVPAVACGIPIVTFGFSGIGRLVVIATEALRDLQSRVDLAPLLPGLRYYVGLPDPDERGIELELDDEAGEAARVQALGERVMGRAFELLGMEAPKDEIRFAGGGHTAFARALERALRALEQGAIEHAIVGAIDSLADPGILQALLDDGRLKTAANPVGFTPGEAGVVILISRRAPERDPVTVESVSLAVRHGVEPNPRGSEKPPEGRAAAACVLESLEAARHSDPPVLVTDHNGEHERAIEWGQLIFRLAEEGLEVEPARAWYPVTSFGDVGAASAGVGICLAARGIERGYAATRCFVVTAAADDGARAALALAAHGTRS